MRRAIRLSMQYHRSSGCWSISTNGPKTLFPTQEEQQRLWTKHVSNCGELFVRSVTNGSTFRFYVEVSSGSTKAQRRTFLNALAAQCR